MRGLSFLFHHFFSADNQDHLGAFASLLSRHTLAEYQTQAGINCSVYGEAIGLDEKALLDGFQVASRVGDSRGSL